MVAPAPRSEARALGLALASGVLPSGATTVNLYVNQKIGCLSESIHARQKSLVLQSVDAACVKHSSWSLVNMLGWLSEVLSTKPPSGQQLVRLHHDLTDCAQAQTSVNENVEDAVAVRLDVSG